MVVTCQYNFVVCFGLCVCVLNTTNALDFLTLDDRR